MKFRCERDDLLEAVQFASRAISNRATLPVLSGLRIEANDEGNVVVAATDLELTMETSFKAGVDEPGKVIVPGRLFGEMSRSLGSGSGFGVRRGRRSRDRLRSRAVPGQVARSR